MEKVYISNYNVFYRSDLYEQYHQDNQICFKEVIDNINHHSVLSGILPKFLEIQFTGFDEKKDIFASFKNIFRNKNTPTFKDSCFYPYLNKVILHKNDLSIGEINEFRVFTKKLSSLLTPSEYLNFIVLHEIGHAVHFNFHLKDYLHLSNPSNENNVKAFINDTIFYFSSLPLYQDNSLMFRSSDLNTMISNATHEGLAELYAAISLSYLYSKEKAIKIIEAIIVSREHCDEVLNERYLTKESLTIFLDDLKNDKIHFKNSSDTFNYMSDVVAQTVENLLTQHFSVTPIYKEVTVDLDGLEKSRGMKRGDKFEFIQNCSISQNKFLGYINSRLKLNLESSYEVVEYLNNYYGLNLGYVEHKQAMFLEGMDKYEKAKKHPTTTYLVDAEKRVKEKITSLKDKFNTSTPSHHKPI